MSEPLTNTAENIFGFSLNSKCECGHDLGAHTGMVIIASKIRDGTADMHCRKCECKKFSEDKKK